jgi:hypothetical protein
MGCRKLLWPTLIGLISVAWILYLICTAAAVDQKLGEPIILCVRGDCHFALIDKLQNLMSKSKYASRKGERERDLLSVPLSSLQHSIVCGSSVQPGGYFLGLISHQN